MKKLLLLMSISAPLVLSACGANEESSVDTAGGDPEKLYMQKCSNCHGGDLTGGAGPSLTNVGAEYTKEEIEQYILEGKGAMPAGQLKDEDASAVAEWLAEKK